MIKSNEEAYETISKYLIAYAHNNNWDKLILNAQIYQQMIQCYESLYLNEQMVNEYREIPFQLSRLNTKAILLLRDNLLKLTGNRIWGLTFTLYPDGKFEIEYDYNKPEGYEETDEVITGEEINQNFLK